MTATGLAMYTGNWKTLLAIGWLLLTVAGCSDNRAAESVTKPPRPVKIAEVKDAAAVQLRHFPAVVQASEVAQLTFRVGGEIEQLPVRAGAEVKQGDLIAALDPTDYQLAVDQAKAQYDLASSQYQRNQKLVQQGLMSEAQFDEIESQLAVAKSNYETAQANLSYTRLEAPFDGIVARLAVEKYENIQPKQPIATLQIADAIDVAIQVPENLFARVSKRLDYEPLVAFDAAPEQRFLAHLKEWDSQADPATNTYEVVFTLPKPENLNILPGMTATVIVDLNQVLRQVLDGVVIPSSAVFADPQGQSYVWRVNDDMTVTQVAVEVGNMTNSGLLISDGLSAGERVVAAGVQQLQNGQSIRQWKRERGL